MSHLPAGAGQDKEAAARAGAIAGLVDVLICVAAACASNSAVLLADALKTFLEFVAVLLAWLAIRRINRGAHHNFDYGIGKLENLSGLFVGILMMLCLLVILGNAIRNFLSPSHVSGLGLWIGIGDQIIYLGINSYLCYRSRQVAAKDNSPAVAAQGRLLFTRAVANAFILIALVLSISLSRFHWAMYIDPCASLLIGGSILLAAFGIFSSSVYDLLDRTLEEKHQLLILRELAGHFDDYEALHGIRSRHAGGQVYVEIFLEFDPQKSVADVQRAINQITESLQSKIPNSHVSIALADHPIA
ncbi:MAG: cation diffusion facilitator family transporter [Verrucomicrobia bacterium]|nr:cation diffusion facilitator family transporter [Verrucomicrobiota bacterium]